MAFIIAADAIKKTLAGYTPEESERFHKQSAKLADKEFQKAIKTRPERKVILMAGGTASGKTEYISTHLGDVPAIVFDGTLPTFQGAEIKIRAALKAKREVEIHLILPLVLSDAFFVFMHRERKFSVAHFYRTHSGCRKSVLAAAKTYDDIKVRVFLSEIDTKNRPVMMFNEMIPPDRPRLLEYLVDNLYTEADIRNILNDDEL